MDNKKLVMVIGGAALAVVIILIIIGFRAQQTKPSAKPQEVPIEFHERQAQETKRLLALDVSDPSHVNNIKYIQVGLEKYYDDMRVYPKKLEDLVPRYLRVLPKYSTEKSYFYAYASKEKPKSYHLGTPLGGRNPSDDKAFSQDADFNSKKAGYENGFDGVDPVYDLVSGVKK